MILDIQFKDARSWQQYQNIQGVAVSPSPEGFLLTIIHRVPRKVEQILLYTVETFQVTND
jgi:hypothetical protein